MDRKINLSSRFPLAIAIHSRRNFTGLYNGIGYVLISAVPSATTFFTVYSLCRWNGTGDWIAAIAGELSSTTIRQPLEVLKQRSQVGMTSSKVFLFRGFFCTLMRDLPFALVQYPLFEALKPTFGAFTAAFTAGFVAGAVTTPLDWIKTRIVLFGRDFSLIQSIRKEGISAMFCGMKERVIWISFGACIFLGTFSFLHNEHKA